MQPKQKNSVCCCAFISSGKVSKKFPTQIPKVPQQFPKSVRKVPKKFHKSSPKVPKVSQTFKNKSSKNNSKKTEQFQTVAKTN